MNPDFETISEPVCTAPEIAARGIFAVLIHDVDDAFDDLSQGFALGQKFSTCEMSMTDYAENPQESLEDTSVSIFHRPGLTPQEMFEPLVDALAARTELFDRADAEEMARVIVANLAQL